MLVEVEELDAQLHIKETAAAELKGWPPRVVERCARFPQAALGAQLVGMLVSDLLEGLGADLLLPLDEEPQRERDRAEPLERLQPVDARHDILFVVGDPASDDSPVLLDRLEQVRVPQLDWGHRLNVVRLV